MTKIIAIIPARGGSKGLPGKNLRVLSGKPLIQHSIDAALGVSRVERVYVSSDDDSILSRAASVGAVPVKRPSELAQDSTPMDPVIHHLLNDLGILSSQEGAVLLLQPTSPLRGSSHIREAIDIFDNNDCSMVMGVSSSDHCPFKGFSRDATGHLCGHFGFDAPFARRQDFPELYFANGAIYLFAIKEFVNSGFKIPRRRIMPMLMSRVASIDIDTEEDLKFAETILGRDKNGG